VGGAKVDVLLRDLDVVEHWSARAADGEFEIDGLLGYLAGIPTYSLLAERSVAQRLRGSLPAAGAFPARLSETAPERWRFARRRGVPASSTASCRTSSGCRACSSSGC
jgi:hypothetical protein